jgi:nucleoside-triphosphatase THEP1
MARWALVSSEKKHDKVALVLRLIDALQSRGVAVGGFVQLRCYDAQEHKGYQLQRLATGEKITLAQGGVGARGPSQEAFCSYAFRNEAFEQACLWIKADAARAQVLFLDDVSKLEVQGKGHAASVAWALSQLDKVVVLCARASQLFYVVENFGLDGDPVDALELPVDAAAEERFVAAIARAAIGAR